MAAPGTMPRWLAMGNVDRVPGSRVIGTFRSSRGFMPGKIACRCTQIRSLLRDGSAGGCWARALASAARRNDLIRARWSDRTDRWSAASAPNSVRESSTGGHSALRIGPLGGQETTGVGPARAFAPANATIHSGRNDVNGNYVTNGRAVGIWCRACVSMSWVDAATSGCR